MASNLSVPCLVRLALASAQPVSGSGEVAVLTFGATGDAGTATDLVFQGGDLNEGAIAVTFHQNGRKHEKLDSGENG